MSCGGTHSVALTHDGRMFSVSILNTRLQICHNLYSSKSSTILCLFFSFCFDREILIMTTGHDFGSSVEVTMDVLDMVGR